MYVLHKLTRKRQNLTREGEMFIKDKNLDYMQSDMY